MYCRGLAVLVLATTALAAPRIASACTPVRPTPFTLDAADADDVTPPAAPAVEPIVRRIEGDGCLAEETTCGKRQDTARVELHVEATDDRAPAETIGYHVRFLAGDTPADLTIIDGPVLAPNGYISLPFDAGDHADFGFRLSVSAVDRNGNYSEPTIVSVGEDHVLSCSSGRVDSNVFVWLALGFLLWPRRRLHRARRARI